MAKVSRQLILGVDTSLRSSGVGVIEVRGHELRAVAYGRIYNRPAELHSQCLWNIFDELSALIEKHQPTCAAIEGAFFAKNAKTAMVLGQARGAVLAVCAAGSWLCSAAGWLGGLGAGLGAPSGDPRASRSQIVAAAGRLTVRCCGRCGRVVLCFSLGFRWPGPAEGGRAGGVGVVSCKAWRLWVWSREDSARSHDVRVEPRCVAWEFRSPDRVYPACLD